MSNSVGDAILEIQKCDEIKYVTYHLVNNIGAAMDNPFVRTNYPDSWVSYYLLNNLVASDPVLRWATASKEPFIWSDIVLSKDEKAFIQKAAEFGLGLCGYSIPCSDKIGRKSVLSLNTDMSVDDWAAFISKNSDDLVSLAQDLHVKAVSEAFAEAGDIPHLSPREYECLKWTSLGKSYSEIAIILSLSEHTIRSYLKVARLKLDSVTLAQAVTKAANMGLL